MANSKGNAFDYGLFKRLMTFTKPYKGFVAASAVAAVSLSLFAALRPLFLQGAIDKGMTPMDMDSLLYYLGLMLVVLVGEVLSQFFFIYWANVLGQNVVRDLRIGLFDHMLKFKMQYYDKSAACPLS